MTKITHKQHTVLEYVQHYMAQHGRSPLIREVQAECQIASYKSTVDRLNALERKGYIRRRPNKHRGIRIVQRLVEPQPQQAGALSVAEGTA